MTPDQGYRVYLKADVQVPHVRFFDVLKFLRATDVGLEFATRQGAVRYVPAECIDHVEAAELPLPGAW